MFHRAYNQVRCVAMLLLVFEHCFSFANQVLNVPLGSVNFLHVLDLVGALSSSVFLLMTGVGFRLGFEGAIAGNRIVKPGFLPLFTLLLWLNLIEAGKDYVVYHSFASVFAWDFLKTILISYVICYALARLHIFLTLIVGIGLDIFSTPICDKLTQFINQAPPSAAEFKWGIFHLNVLFLMLAIGGFFALRIALSQWPRRVKTVLLSLLSLLFLRGLFHLLHYEAGPQDILASRSWLLRGFAGEPSGNTLFPVLAWCPSILVGFGGCHLVLQFRERLSKLSFPKAFSLSSGLYVVLSVIALRALGPQIHGASVWDVDLVMRTSFTGELLRVLSVLSLFFFFTLLDPWTSKRSFSSFSLKISIASFWIYLLATSWSRWIAVLFAEHGSPLILCSLIAFVSTMFFALIVSEIAYMAHTKRLRLVLRRA